MVDGDLSMKNDDLMVFFEIVFLFCGDVVFFFLMGIDEDF